MPAKVAAGSVTSRPQLGAKMPLLEVVTRHSSLRPDLAGRCQEGASWSVGHHSSEGKKLTQAPAPFGTLALAPAPVPAPASAPPSSGRPDAFSTRIGLSQSSLIDPSCRHRATSTRLVRLQLNHLLPVLLLLFLLQLNLSLPSSCVPSREQAIPSLRASSLLVASFTYFEF